MISNYSGYLESYYAINPYLISISTGSTACQIFFKIEDFPKKTGSQLSLALKDGKSFNFQMALAVQSNYSISTQIEPYYIYSLKSQINLVIYNSDNLRILYQYPSRGNTGTNWSVILGGTAPGDFSINNLNTDLVEQAYRSTSTTIAIQCDTQISQGIFNDTVAILNHNLTRSATVTLLGSNVADFSTVSSNVNLKIENENIFWVSEKAPIESYRYWRFAISDITNSSGYIQIGTIVFGSSVIFSGECFIDEVTRRKTHFADRIRTEGFSSVSNDRALKRAVSLSFKRLNFNYENYANLIKVIDHARTSLKCLWIPTPQYASRFAVFGKLAEMPSENHKVISESANYIDVDINVDEAL